MYAMIPWNFSISQIMAKPAFILHFKNGKQIQPPVVRRAKHLQRINNNKMNDYFQISTEKNV